MMSTITLSFVVLLKELQSFRFLNSKAQSSSLEELLSVAIKYYAEKRWSQYAFLFHSICNKVRFGVVASFLYRSMHSVVESYDHVYESGGTANIGHNAQKSLPTHCVERFGQVYKSGVDVMLL